MDLQKSASDILKCDRSLAKHSGAKAAIWATFCVVTSSERLNRIFLEMQSAKSIISWER